MHRYAVSTRDKNVDHAGADTINLRLKRSSKLTANSSFDGILKRLSIRGGGTFTSDISALEAPLC